MGIEPTMNEKRLFVLTDVADMFVVKENEITGSMYIVHVGRVKESCEKSITTRSYYPGEFFGEVI